jgi:hypothetical protein
VNIRTHARAHALVNVAQGTALLVLHGSKHPHIHTCQLAEMYKYLYRSVGDCGRDMCMSEIIGKRKAA